MIRFKNLLLIHDFQKTNSKLAINTLAPLIFLVPKAKLKQQLTVPFILVFVTDKRAWVALTSTIEFRRLRVQATSASSQDKCSLHLFLLGYLSA